MIAKKVTSKNITIMKYFTLQELTRTGTNLQNVPDAQAEKNLIALIEKVLEPIRILWGTPIKINSGFRNIAVNKAVGGAVNSQHLKGQAADITAGSPAENKKLFDLISKSGIVFDQLIDEQKYKWLHISFNENGNRKQILHL